jgi:hypothetical protein
MPLEVSMNRPKKPAYWQLDLFLLLMVGLLMLAMWAQLPTGWETVIDIVWALVAIGGMGVWVWASWPALSDEQRKQQAEKRSRAASGRDTSHLRDVPLTPVQRRFLSIMGKYTRR